MLLSISGRLNNNIYNPKTGKTIVVHVHDGKDLKFYFYICKRIKLYNRFFEKNLLKNDKVCEASPHLSSC